ncbi:MAG TPA: LCP family protein [Candidatus Limnocylindria bacterium]|nr:LCP family protein [Candidatus Limnocylindria bacterium]
MRGSPGFAAVLSLLLPGLGQMYLGRWIRGVLMILIPIFAVLVVGALVAIADPLTSFVLRNAAEVTFLVAAAFFMYHLFVVTDAFGVKLRGMGSLRGQRVVDYLVLGLVCIALVGFYATTYRGSAPWAGLFTKVFAPIANPPSVGTSSSQDYSPPEWTERERLNVLLLGVDSRGDSSSTLNTDTMIVLSLDPVNKTAAMLSIPRDVYIDRPGVFTDKINAAYAFGGYDLTRKVVEDLLGIRLNAYALVDFDAFTKIVDSVGGVIVDVKRPVRDESYPTPDYGIERIDITAGPQLMDGQTALRFARSRHDTNDYSRAQRQQLVLSALRTRISEGDFLRGLPVLIDRVGSAVQTNFDPANILPLARFGTGIDGNAIRSEVLYPCGGSYPHCELQASGGDGGFYLIPDRAKIRDLAATLFYDPQVKAEGAAVEVRSAGARNGVAQSVADRLTERAFTVSTVSDGATGRSAILVRNGAKRYTANALAAQLGGLPVDTLSSSETTAADIVVRVGSDFRGLATDLAR